MPPWAPSEVILSSSVASPGPAEQIRLYSSIQTQGRSKGGSKGFTQTGSPQNDSSDGEN